MGIKSNDTKTLIIDPAKWKDKFQDSNTEKDLDSITEEMGESYTKNVNICLERGKKRYRGDFFIVVLSRIEVVSNEVFRSSYLHRSSCPTPNYDQIVFHYDSKDDVLRELWVIPDRPTCIDLSNNSLEAKMAGDPLLEHVLNFADGTLDKIMAELNGEKQFSLELEVEKLKKVRKQGDLFK